MRIYKIPLKFKAGGFKFGELNVGKEDESLRLEYNTKYQMLTYSVPMYENKARIYMVPKSLMPNGLIAMYDDSGELDKVELAQTECTRLIYIRFKNNKASEKAVLEFVQEQADKMSAEIIGRKQKLARLFFGTFYDGEAVEIVVMPAAAEEVKAVIDEYDGQLDAIDNCGNYPIGNMIMLDNELLGVMLMCTNCDFQSKLFDMAVTTVRERIKKRISNQIDKTDDFKFISEEGD